MEQYNLILILDKNITAVAATERNRSDIITVCGEDSIPLRGENSIDEVIENIKEHYSILDFNDKCINTIIIKNGASEKLAVYTLEKCDGSADRNIVNMLALAPMLVRNKGLDLPATISLNGIGYCIDENGVALTDNTDTATGITYDDLLFLFWVKPEILNSNFDELKKVHEEAKHYIDMSIEQSFEISELNKQIDELNANCDWLTSQIEKKNIEIEKLKKKSETFEVANDSEFRNKLKEYVSKDINLTDYCICKKTENGKTAVYISHSKSGAFQKIILNADEVDGDNILRKTAWSIEKLNQSIEYNHFDHSKLAKLKVGDIIKFGTYQQGLKPVKEEIEWQILAIENGKALLLSKYALDNMRFDTGYCDHWSDCSLRKWINNDFYNSAFSSKEKKQIVKTVLSDCYNHPQDNVFLLSKEEAEKYLKTNMARSCRATDFAKSRGAEDSTSFNCDHTCSWWLRTYDSSYFVINVWDTGSLGNITVDSSHVSVRPAIWISL